MNDNQYTSNIAISGDDVLLRENAMGDYDIRRKVVKKPVIAVIKKMKIRMIMKRLATIMLRKYRNFFS